MAKHNIWMSVSDLMTGLMVIFLFVAIAYMLKVRENQNVLTDYVETRQHLHEKLVNEFKGDTAEWKMTVGKDLSMKFKEPQVLFVSGSDQLQPRFCKILDDFIPRYLNILLNDSLADRIQEIRIEGHTDDVLMKKYGNDPYLSNVLLSQMRSYNVLKYIRDMPAYQQFTEEQQKRLEFWFTANGLSYGKALDDEDEYVAVSHKVINRDKSRRVEFRLVTSGEEVLENFVDNINKP